MTYRIYSSESANMLPYVVMWDLNGRTERAKHLGKRGQFKTYEEAKQAVFNAERYGTQNV